MILCIIPARGGSKRFPRKNIALLNGKPLIYYTIEAWRKSKYYEFNSPIVSSDDDEILITSRAFGAETIKRPSSLSQGDLPSPVPVIENVIDYLTKYRGWRIGWIVLLQPTSPLRSSQDIDICLECKNGNCSDCFDYWYNSSGEEIICVCECNTNKDSWDRIIDFDEMNDEGEW